MIPFDWITGPQNAFLLPYRDNEALFARAQEFWHSLQNYEVGLIICALVVGILFAILYYTAWNKIARPGGYHYRIRHWFLFWGVSFIICFAGSFYLYDFVKYKNINSIAQGFQFSLSFCNGILCLIIFFIVSLLWCNWGKTNAYPFLKFRK